MTKSVDEQYDDLCVDILKNGEWRINRTGVRTIALFGYQMRFDLRQGFPLLTSKKIYPKNIIHELLWFLRRETNINTLKAPQIWQPWADENGECYRAYGAQWRDWPSYGSRIDQIAGLLHSIKTNPDSRRHIVTAWNPADVDKMALPSCHCFFQCNVSGAYLDLHMYQRSCDTGIGLPFNIASYAILQTMIAQECGLTPRNFIHSFGDVHIYENQLDGIKEQLTRSPRPMPCLRINAKYGFWELANRDNPEDFAILDYNPHPFIKLPVAV